MNFFAKLGFIALVAGVGTTALYAFPNRVGDAGTDEAMVRGQQLRNEMLEDGHHVQHLQALARREKDVIKLNCVNDKLVQIRPLLNIGDRAQADIAAGQAGGMAELTNARQTVHRLREAADQCIGEPSLGNESINTYTHPPIFDPTATDPWGPTFEPPGYASPMN